MALPPAPVPVPLPSLVDTAVTGTVIVMAPTVACAPDVAVWSPLLAVDDDAPVVAVWLPLLDVDPDVALLVEVWSPVDDVADPPLSAVAEPPVAAPPVAVAVSLPLVAVAESSPLLAVA